MYVLVFHAACYQMWLLGIPVSLVCHMQIENAKIVTSWIYRNALVHNPSSEARANWHFFVLSWYVRLHQVFSVVFALLFLVLGTWPLDLFAFSMQSCLGSLPILVCAFFFCFFFQPDTFFCPLLLCFTLPTPVALPNELITSTRRLCACLLIKVHVKDMFIL